MKMAFGQWARGTCQWAASQNGCGGRSHLWKRNWGFWRRLLESCASVECGVWVGVGRSLIVVSKEKVGIGTRDD